MREKLINYVDLLFAGAPQAQDIKQEILQNTLDRYDDLVAQGKTPEAAYQLAISGIGDIRELLSGQSPEEIPAAQPAVQHREKPMRKKVVQALAICLYILSPLPLFILQNELGLCGVLAICAVATALIIIASGGQAEAKDQPADNPQTELHKTVSKTVSAVVLVIYLAVSFATGAWYISWVIFVIGGAVNGLIRACFDLKEAKAHEA